MGSIFSKTNDNSPDSSQNTTMENLSFELSSHPHSPIKTVCRTPVNVRFHTKNIILKILFHII